MGDCPSFWNCVARELCIFLLNSEEQSKWDASNICELLTFGAENRNGERVKMIECSWGKALEAFVRMATVRL